MDSKGKWKILKNTAEGKRKNELFIHDTSQGLKPLWVYKLQFNPVTDEQLEMIKDSHKSEKITKGKAENSDAKKSESEAEQKKKDEEAALKKKTDEEAQKIREKEELELKKKQEEEAEKNREKEEAELKKKAEEDAQKKEADEEAQKKKAEEEAQKKKAEEEAQKKKAEEEAQKKKAEEEAEKQKRLDMEAEIKEQMEKELRQKIEEEMRLKMEQEIANNKKLDSESKPKTEPSDSSLLSVEGPATEKIGEKEKTPEVKPSTVSSLAESASKAKQEEIDKAREKESIIQSNRELAKKRKADMEETNERKKAKVPPWGLFGVGRVGWWWHGSGEKSWIH